MTLPQVRSASVDRAFPQTVRVTIVPERAVAIAPNGSERVVLAASGRVLGPVTPGTLGLPLIAAAPGDLPAVGGSVQSAAVRQELRVAAAPRRGLRFTAIGFTADGLTGRTAQGLDIRLGDDEDLAAKLRVARSVLRRAGAGADYIDVSVPGAPVLRQSSGDPLTVDAPPPVAPALPAGADDGASGNWSGGASPAESIRTLFG
jgi:cell division septal protein FtsQ